MNALYRLTAESPLGPITLVEDAGALMALEWGGNGSDATRLLEDAHRQIADYFTGTRRVFDLPLAPRVRPLQQRFLEALVAIPFGETRTYGQMAQQTGLSAQAAGQACGANPIAIIIPCHRVLGADTLGGFSAAGGIEAKVKLLKHEGAASLLI